MRGVPEQLEERGEGLRLEGARTGGDGGGQAVQQQEPDVQHARPLVQLSQAGAPRRLPAGVALLLFLLWGQKTEPCTEGKYAAA